MSETWYRAVRWTNTIARVQVEKTTPLFVVIRGRRHARYSEGEWYMPTYTEARDRLIEHHVSRVASARTLLAIREEDLNKARAIPTEERENP